MGVSPLPPGTGVAIGFFTGLAVGMALGPMSLLLLPLFLQRPQLQFSGGQRDVLGDVVIIPIDSSGGYVSEVFTRAPAFMIVQGNSKRIIPNPYKDVPGNAAHLVVNMLLKYNPRKVIVRNIGRNAENLLRMAGVEIEKR